jgi:hypothetical protein
MQLFGDLDMLSFLRISRLNWIGHVNPLNTELNHICHLLVLLGDLTFMGPCIVSIFQHISKKMQHYTFYLYLETALHVSSVTSTHHQERIYSIYSIWYFSDRYCYLSL